MSSASDDDAADNDDDDGDGDCDDPWRGAQRRRGSSVAPSVVVVQAWRAASSWRAAILNRTVNGSFVASSVVVAQDSPIWPSPSWFGAVSLAGSQRPCSCLPPGNL